MRKEAEMRYKVTFAFRAEDGEVCDYLDNNGRGFNLEDAHDIARQLRQNGHWNVAVVKME